MNSPVHHQPTTPRQCSNRWYSDLPHTNAQYTPIDYTLTDTSQTRLHTKRNQMATHQPITHQSTTTNWYHTPNDDIPTHDDVRIDCTPTDVTSLLGLHNAFNAHDFIDKYQCLASHRGLHRPRASPCMKFLHAEQQNTTQVSTKSSNKAPPSSTSSSNRAPPGNQEQ